MRSSPFSFIGVLIVLLIIVSSPFLLLFFIGYILVKVFFGQPNTKTFNPLNFFNRQETADLDNIQVEGFTVLLAYLLKETHHNQPREIDTGKEAIRSLIQQVFPDFINSPQEEEALKNFEAYCTQQNIEAQLYAERLRQSFLYSNSKLSSSSFLQLLVLSYTSIKGDNNVEERFVHTLMQIAANIGANNIIVGIILARFTTYQSQFNSFNSFFGFEQEQSQYQGYSNYRNNSGGYSGGGYAGGATPSSSFREACRYLGVSEDVTAKELKSRRRKLLNQWHPDKAPPGKQEEYNKKSQEINQYADIIEAYKGF